MISAPRSTPLLTLFMTGLAILALIAGAGFRYWHIGAEPLWLDEAYSAYAAGKGLDFLWNVVPRYETHPPFYYSLVHFWTLAFGDSVLGLRSLGAVASLLTLGAIFICARNIAGFLDFTRQRAMMLAAAALVLAALSPMLIEMTREVRPYPVLILAYGSAITALFAVARQVDAGRGLLGWPYAIYVALLPVILWMHNLGALYASALGLSALVLCYRRSWGLRDWGAFVAGHLIAILFWVPALLILADQAPTWIKSTWLRFPPANLIGKINSLYVIPGAGTAVACLLVVLAALGTGNNGKGRRTFAALFLLAVLPLALSLILSALVAPVFIMRVMTAVAFPAMLLLALGLAATRRPLWAWVAAAGIVLIGVDMARVDVRARQGGAQQDWHRAVDWLASRVQPGDMVFAYPNEGALPFRYALRDRGLKIGTRPIPTDMPTLDGGPGSWNPTGSRGVFSLPREQLEAIAAAPEAQSVSTIWLLRLGAHAYDKGDHFLHALERDRVRVDRYTDGPIDLIGLRRRDLAPVAAGEQAKP